MKTLITAFLLTFLYSIYSYSQDFDIVTFEGEEYYLLPKDFEPYKTGLKDTYPNYINNFQLPDGKWMAFLEKYPDKPAVTGQYKDGLAVGLWKFYSIAWDDTTSFVFLTTEYVDGKRNGEQLYYSVPGTLTQKFEFKDDEYHGDFITYNAQGMQLVVGQYMYGIPVTKWTFRDHYGSLLRIESYRESINPDSIEFYKDKNRYIKPQKRIVDYNEPGHDYEMEYIPSAEGTWIDYYSDGKTIRRESIYKNGLMVYVTEYYENGHKKMEGPTISAIDYSNIPVKRSYTPGEFKNYIENGMWTFYDNMGAIIKTIHYKNGLIIE